MVPTKYNDKCMTNSLADVCMNKEKVHLYIDA